MDSEEKAIIREAQRGNVLAFESLVKKYDRQVLRLAYSLLSSRQDAEDVYQEVFVRVYRKLPDFRFKSEFSTWLHRVVVNYCINHQRKAKRNLFFSLDKSLDPDSEGWKETLASNEQNPEERAVNQELACEIETALAQLSAKQKAVFVLRHFHGHKLKEIATIMQCSEGTVKNYLFRATSKMRTLLQQHALK